MAKKKEFHLLRTSLIILIVCAIIGLSVTCYKFFGQPDPTYASASIQLSFDGAAQGILPNGSKYDAGDLTSDEILNAALEGAGMTGVYTPEQLRNSINVTPSYPTDILEQVVSYESLLNFTANRKLTIGDYHPTTFGVELKNDFDKSISQGKLEEMLKQIMTVYQAHVIRIGSNALDSEDAILNNYTAYDYPQQLEILSNHLALVAENADEMYAKDATFRLNGVGFNDISVQLNNLITNNISQLNAEITMNALTKDTARLLTQYQFEIRDLNNQLEKQNQRLAKIDDLTKSYEKNEIIYLSTADSLTKIDGNSSVTYDKLVEERKVVTDLIAELRSRISTYTLRMNDLMGKTAEEKTPVVPEETAEAGTPAEEGTAETEAAETGTSETETTEAETELTKKEIEEAAAQAEELNKQRVAKLEKNIAALKEKTDAVIAEYQKMLDAYNAAKLNDVSVRIYNFQYKTPKVLSGAFIKAVVKEAGPFGLIGICVCLMMVFIAKRRKARAEKVL